MGVPWPKLLLLLSSIVLGVLGGCRGPGAAPPGPERDGSGPATLQPTDAAGSSLPPPDVKGRLPLESVLASRRSSRQLEAAPLSRAELGQLAWAAQGLTGPAEGRRAAPSAGALYPLELYFVMAEGVLHYLPSTHALERVGERDLRPSLAEAALGQAAVREAPCVAVLTGVSERTARKYGARAPRFVAMEAGHAAQNLLLQAEALGLGAVPIGGFDEQAVSSVLALRSGEEPLYLVPVGRRRAAAAAE